MRPTLRSSASRIALFATIAGFVLAPRAASAQYTGQVLAPPSDPGFSPDSETEAFAINAKSQVFGAAFSTPLSSELVRWTGGVPQSLQLPAGSTWGNEGGKQFFNDNGTVVTSVTFQNSPPGAGNQIARWMNGSQTADVVPPTPPSAMAPPACSASYVAFYPVGLNNAGHILILATDASGSCPWMLWIWDGAGSSPDHYQEITPINNGSGGCAPAFNLRFEGNHLNDEDHIGLVFGPRDGAGASCPTPLTAGILAGGTYTPVIQLVAANGGGQGLSAGVAAINNRDQVVGYVGDINAPDLQFWNGTSVGDLGNGAFGGLNDLGHIFFLSLPGRVPRLYKNGTTTDVSIPAIPGFVIEPADRVFALGNNSTGQLLMSLGLHRGGSTGPLADRAVVLSPTPPTITLKVNGQHPSPPVVTTAGPMSLTLDVSPSAYTGTVSWYWVLVVNSQALWVTSTGLMTTPAPLAVAPPAAIASAPLLNVMLPPGTTVVTAFFFVDASNAGIAGDLIAASRP